MGFSSALKPNCIAEGSSIPLYGVCVFTCPEGYLFKKTRARTATRYCKDHETWSGEDDVCIGLLALYTVHLIVVSAREICLRRRIREANPVMHPSHTNFIEI